MSTESDRRLLQLVDDYISGRFTIASEKPLIDEIIQLTSPTLSNNDVFEVLFEDDIQTPEEGVAALRAFVKGQTK